MAVKLCPLDSSDQLWAPGRFQGQPGQETGDPVDPAQRLKTCTSRKCLLMAVPLNRLTFVGIYNSDIKGSMECHCP